MPPEPFQYTDLFLQLEADGGHEWVQRLSALCGDESSVRRHGDLQKWMNAWHRLPNPIDTNLDASGPRVVVGNGHLQNADQDLRETLMNFHPWRKGPFDFFGLHIDTEWRSDWKWKRLHGHVEFRNRRVLDVGCGNGYFGWKMLHAGASCVVGLDPFPLYVMQHEVIKRFAPDRPNFVLPVGDDCLPERLGLFDVTLSMGVLYHRTSPIDHLKTLYETLRSGGQLLLETLVIDDENESVLVPEGRYAKMRNVWFLPSVTMLHLWLRRSGFHEIQTIDITATTVNEQRSTDWMTFESLPDFLNPHDASRTIEGYPSPVRAMVTAVK